jgi:hypothetical protein
MDLGWHEKDRQDVGHAWFRERLAALCATLAP